jgi:hypothetical protein
MSSTPSAPKDQAPSGFLSRWSQRKVQVRQGALPPEPAPVPAATVPVPPVVPPAEPVAAPAPPPPTLADVAAHDDRSPDFSRFVAPGVDSSVRNAALHKLFSDPHFNVMDGLDTYIEDYGLADPIPPAMLRQMVQSHALGLFDHEKTETPADAAATQPVATAPVATPDDADAPPDAATALPPAEPLPDENADLRLQPDDAAGRPGPEPGPGQDPGR